MGVAFPRWRMADKLRADLIKNGRADMTYKRIIRLVLVAQIVFSNSLYRLHDQYIYIR